MTPLHPEFGVQLESRPISSLDIDAVRATIDRHSFVHVPGAAEGDEAHLAFTRRLGEPEANHVVLGREGRVEYFGTIGNVRSDGSTAGNAHEHTVFQTGNNMWHSDSSFRAVPAFVSIMCAYETPEEGGETLFVSQRAAWDRLEEVKQDQLAPLVCIHDYVFSRSKVGPNAVTPSHAASLPPVRQRLVRRNPAHGARNLYVGSHAREIEGWSFEESRELLDGLVEEMTAAAHVLSHRWQPGDLVIWDNRCLLHRGAGYDADRFRRRMRQTRVAGTGPTLEE
ncbi:MAG: TauD/TfdA family dioxygenase [Alphaproteobacteria bacterium]|nr:TauD/TfdA family dioxygenase [Alphaproteobacteria bacterium]MCY4231032.1 TauD/TfdA family dioxygenase [Alphaproteobacteria bacterium]MCY4320499.1 TauD/TfdA family dioxygenase [Alphaproteobacteria bacterium]